MSHKTHSPISSLLSWLLKILVSRSSTSCTEPGNARTASSSAVLCASVKFFVHSPRAMASSVNVRMVDENTLVDATPISLPARTLMKASLSFAMVESASLTTPMMSTFWPFVHFLTNLRLSTASDVSPELETTKSTSPGRTRGLRYLYSDAYCTSTGIRAMCSIRYSATSAAWLDVPQPMMTNLLLKEPPSGGLQAAITSIGVRPASPWPSGRGCLRLGKSALPSPLGGALR
mmetsp:Transcript_93357/g.253265  ORF Transcript_93357/g.253265 Transcript_93357/m.253265 type:complete len:232 (+) Transcript_93357:551-1246(+)